MIITCPQLLGADVGEVVHHGVYQGAIDAVAQVHGLEEVQRVL